MNQKKTKGMSVADFGSNIIPLPATITGISQLTDNEKLFTLRFDNGNKIEYKPCQFVMVSVYGIGEAPISISSSPTEPGGTIDLCIRSIGNLTGAIHRLNVNDKIGVRGPYGNGFPMEKILGKDILIVAGGLGLAPLRSLINHIRCKREQYRRVIILIGAKRPKNLLFRDEIAIWEEDASIEVHRTVDVAEPSWDMHVGVITGLFKYFEMEPLNTVAAVVGPPIMYRFVIRDLLKKGIFEGNIYISLERRMRCGLGKCGHCQINGIYVCQDGPVFSYRRAKKLQEAL
jgi:sulfite reductase subunit B